MSSIVPRASAIVLGIVAALIACTKSDASLPFPDRCNIMVAQVTPSAPSLAVVDTVTLHAAYTAGVSSDCIPDVPASSLRWTSSSPSVATVDSATGRLIARGAGTAIIYVHLPGSEAVLGSTQVTVVVH